MANIGLLIAGGSGNRMHQDIPKQFLTVNEKPVIVYTLTAFEKHPEIDAIAVVCIAGWEQVLWAYAKQFGITKLKWVVSGGKSGQESIRNGVYNLEGKAEKDFKVSTEEKIKYSLNNCIINALISFVICFIVEIIIGILFFNTKKKVDNSIEFNKIMMAKNDNSVLKKIKCLFTLFFFLNFILIIIFCLFLLGFNIINSNSETDFLIPSLVTFLLLQIIPFLTNIIITIIMYFGLKNDNKKMINIGKTFLF